MGYKPQLNLEDFRKKIVSSRKKLVNKTMNIKSVFNSQSMTERKQSGEVVLHNEIE